ncbi:MAG: hypothetical protein JWO10_273 [Microbacteriaceae bacterium]|nr:hypothetical protein [Microbacteriaceae bacterium]
MSGSAVKARNLEITIPNGWYPLSSSPDGTDAAIAVLLGSFELQPDAVERLEHALRMVSAVVQEPQRGGRPHWAYIPEPEQGRVEALLSIGFLIADDGAIDRYRGIAEAELNKSDSTDLVRRIVRTATLLVGPAIVVQDFVVEPVAGGVPNPAVERATVALFPTEAEKAVEFSIMTQNLALFPDIVEYLLEIAAAVHEVQVSDLHSTTDGQEAGA